MQTHLKLSVKYFSCSVNDLSFDPGPKYLYRQHAILSALKLGRLTTFVDDTCNVKQFVHQPNNNQNRHVKAGLVVRREQGDDTAHTIQNVESIGAVHANGKVLVATGFKRGSRKHLIDGGSYVVREWQDVVEQLKGPIQIPQRNEKASEQKGCKPAGKCTNSVSNVSNF